MKNNTKETILEMVEDNNHKIRRIEKRLEGKKNELIKLSQGSIREISIFAGSIVNSIKEDYKELEAIIEQNEMLKYLLEQEK